MSITASRSRRPPIFTACLRTSSQRFLKSLQIDILFGDAGHEIAKLAERQGAELIVLPSHGRTGIKRLLIGSVAERVVRLAHCPVLILSS